MIRVLVVEDNPDVQVLLEDLLDTYPWDFNVEITDQGAKAIEMARANPPDLVLLDVQLADKVSGFDVANEIRVNPNTSHAKILMLSALDAPVHEHTGLKAGADNYITKPIQNRILLSALADLLDT